MINKNHEVYKHKHICLVEEHQNPLGIVRSLGEEGIKPIVLLCAHNPVMVNNSKYVGELHIFDNIEEGFAFFLWSIIAMSLSNHLFIMVAIM